MLYIKEWGLLTQAEKKQCLQRPVQNSDKQTIVLDIIKQVQNFGDKALVDLTEQLDGPKLKSLRVPQEEVLAASIDQRSLTALYQAIQTLTSYNQSVLPENTEINTCKGINIRTIYKPIQAVGLYVPGGNNPPLVSSVLMQAIPAKIAGCPIKILCTPPDKNGKVNQHLLVAARLCGIETIYSVGGAQAIAAMAYGTESITKVDKIFGPGNSYVTEAKTFVAQDAQGAAIDMPAGPSEVMILADEKANPAFIAADLLAQAEHGIDSQVFLVCDSINLANQVNQQLEIQLKRLSRQEVINQSLAHSSIFLCTTKEEQIALVNAYAPEHLIINREDAELWVDYIYAAGTIFLGPWAAETMGDYVTGSNHILPTNGFARTYNGLSTSDFLTRFTVQAINEEGIKSLGNAAIKLAQIEGLDAHANALKIRLNNLGV